MVATVNDFLTEGFSHTRCDRRYWSQSWGQSKGRPTSKEEPTVTKAVTVATRLGGIYVETFNDVVFRVPPLTDPEAQEMIRQIRGYRLLEGVRGEPAVDVRALAEILERFSQLVEDLPQSPR